MLSSKPLEGLGDLRGVVFDFGSEGDVLAKHVHTESDVHVTIVATGRIRAYSHDWSIEAGPGQMLNFRAHEPHEIVALEEGTRIFNIQKNYSEKP